jgi:hypothetical protein
LRFSPPQKNPPPSKTLTLTVAMMMRTALTTCCCTLAALMERTVISRQFRLLFVPLRMPWSLLVCAGLPFLTAKTVLQLQQTTTIQPHARINTNTEPAVLLYIYSPVTLSHTGVCGSPTRHSPSRRRAAQRTLCVACSGQLALRPTCVLPAAGALAAAAAASCYDAHPPLPSTHRVRYIVCPLQSQSPPPPNPEPQPQPSSRCHDTIIARHARERVAMP